MSAWERLAEAHGSAARRNRSASNPSGLDNACSKSNIHGWRGNAGGESNAGDKEAL
jgi:hypothetical protein